jgi:hypothetical protein
MGLGVDAIRTGGARSSPLVGPSNGFSNRTLFIGGRSVSPGVKHATYKMEG